MRGQAIVPVTIANLDLLDPTAMVMAQGSIARASATA
jgi:hypothetical protein